MKIIVTGLECSGTKWVASLLRKHPGVEEVLHRSIPEFGAPNTRWPELSGWIAIVWVIRYEPFRLLSIDRAGHATGRPEEFLPPALYSYCYDLWLKKRGRIFFTSYESLVGPLGPIVFADLLAQLDLSCRAYREEPILDAQDGNAKYLNNTVTS